MTADLILSVPRRFVAQADPTMLDVWAMMILRNVWPRRNWLTEFAIVHLYERGYLLPQVAEA